MPPDTVARKRILFVDDERPVLDALRALLRHRRHEWDMVFVEGGREALERLEAEPFDVIVSDMRMPGMDGGTLLRHVQARFPHVVRLVLSGYADQDAVLGTIAVTHQFLLKPCTPAVLEGAIERACRLHALVSDPAIRACVGGIDNLPSLPGTYLELTRVLADDSAGVAELAAVVERDSATSAKLLQVVNSSFIGLGREVTSIPAAVSYLGTSTIRDLALVVHAFQPSRRDVRVDPVAKDVQEHSLRTAALARRIAGDDRRLQEESFTAALLHDLGKFVLATQRPDETLRARERSRAEHLPLADCERAELGVTHAEVGAYLLGIWGLPYAIVEAVANHHTPDRVPRNDALDALVITCIANELVHELECRDGGGPAYTPVAEALAGRELRDRLPDWRMTAAQLADAGEDRLAA